MTRFVIVALALAEFGCGAATPQPRLPLDVGSDARRDDVAQLMSSRGYCQRSWDETARVEEYAPCGAAEDLAPGQPAVTVRYNPDGRYGRLQRHERYAAAPEARARFDELVAMRTRQSGAPRERDKRNYVKMAEKPLAWHAWYLPAQRATSYVFLFERAAVVEELIPEARAVTPRQPSRSKQPQ